jgi:hypothetical protein
MRSHADIIDAAEGYAAFAEALTASGFPVAPSRARFWRRRNSIPAEAWAGVAKSGLTTLEELAEAAARKPDAEDRAA